jgi:hypothetical protein
MSGADILRNFLDILNNGYRGIESIQAVANNYQKGSGMIAYVQEDTSHTQKIG